MIRGLLLGILALFALSVPSVTLAYTGEDTPSERDTKQRQTATAAREKAQARLDETHKKVCELRATNIGALMNRSVKRAENFGQFFTTTTERVKHFVENQQQPVDPQFLDAVSQAQAQFKTDLATLKEKAVFSCDSDNPKGQIAAFQEAHRTVLHDLKDWRAALKNLIEPFTARTEDAS